MKISPITNFNSYNNASRKENVNFGVKLYLENRVPRFIYKKAADKAFRQGLDAQKVLNETYAGTMKFFGALIEKVKPIEPLELPVFIELTEAANEYADESIINGSTIVVGGREFPANTKAFRIRAQSPFRGSIVKDYMEFELDEEGMQKFEKEINTFADVIKPFFRQ